MIQTQPLVSVIIPVYNAEKTIIRTLESVVNQTYKNIEILVINDGSKDNSEQLISNYVSQVDNKNIRLISKENGGVSSARNRGIDYATGDFIAFLDSDDFWLPNKIEMQLNVFENNPQIDCLATNMNKVVLKKIFGFSFKQITEITPRMMMLKNFLCIQTVLAKKEAIKNTGYFIKRHNEDANYMIRMSLKHKTYLLNEPLVIYRDGVSFFGYESGRSSNFWAMERGQLIDLKNAIGWKIIKWYEFPFYVTFSLLKYFNRVLISYYKKYGKN